MAASLKELLRLDLSWWNMKGGVPTPVSWGWPRILVVAFVSRGFKAVLYHRLARQAQLRNNRLRRWFWDSMLYRSTGAEISATAEIAGGFRLPHPQGVVIGGARIGNLVTIQQDVTLGGNFGATDVEGRKFPFIDSMATICAWAVVTGPVDVGKHSIVGANAVVTHSVPDLTVAGGVPAKPIKPLDPQHVSVVNLRKAFDAVPAGLRLEGLKT